MLRASQLAALLVWMSGCVDAERGPATVTPPPADVTPPPPSTPPATAPATTPSLHDVGGHPLKVELVLDKSRLMVHDPAFVTMVFAGDGIEIEVAWMGRNSLGRPDNYRLVFIDAGGASLPVPDAGMQMGGTTWAVELTPGHEHRTRLLLAHWVDGLVPGRYTLRGETTIRARTKAGPWQPLTVAAEVAVEVVPDDPAALARILDDLGAVALGSDHDAVSEALRQLAVVHDPHVVPLWLRIAEVPDYGRKYAAVRALSSWNDDRALAAIVRAGATRAADLPADGYTTQALRDESAAQVRAAAAQALSESPHPGALDALLAMKSDASPSVRLTVLHRAAKLAEPTRRARLTDFATDSDPLVRGEAERYLAER